MYTRTTPNAMAQMGFLSVTLSRFPGAIGTSIFKADFP
jgi:hypothetical protein